MKDRLPAHYTEGYQPPNEEDPNYWLGRLTTAQEAHDRIAASSATTTSGLNLCGKAATGKVEVGVPLKPAECMMLVAETLKNTTDPLVQELARGMQTLIQYIPEATMIGYPGRAFSTLVSQAFYTEQIGQDKTGATNPLQPTIATISKLPSSPPDLHIARGSDRPLQFDVG